MSKLHAQRFTKSKQYWSIGGSINAMNYFGDITPAENFTSTDLKFTRYNIGIHAIHRMTPRFSTRFAFNYGRLRGDDYESQKPTDKNAIFRYLRNNSFRTSIYELSVVGMLDLVENRQSYLRRPEFVPYLFGGVAGFYYNPKAQEPGNPGNWVALQPLQTEGKSYSLFQIAIPFGVGFRYKASTRWDVSFEIGYRYLFTDYLDDVSGNYADPATLKSDLARKMASRSADPKSADGIDRQLGGDGNTIGVLDRVGYRILPFESGNIQYQAVQGYAAGDKRGSPKEKDWYLITGFHINYILVKGVRCPKFR
ncbi:DUF6089 family protein [Cytophagaceae bacterium YF14B1]|uniref:DUF6089 family protein n=1 Tax=Xanthocytophaga flava TaxID=3048013 RepID=A0AAE3QTW7_9BACT|nr:DUF6089 family protein [Xanthocytophaga flavus]MDJ1483161.1 DUF6089 family protein [Xanthocytophaga flavus]